jgi:hypothetical protein
MKDNLINGNSEFSYFIKCNPILVTDTPKYKPQKKDCFILLKQSFYDKLSLLYAFIGIRFQR